MNATNQLAARDGTIFTNASPLCSFLAATWIVFKALVGKIGPSINS